MSMSPGWATTIYPCLARRPSSTSRQVCLRLLSNYCLCPWSQRTWDLCGCSSKSQVSISPVFSPSIKPKALGGSLPVPDTQSGWHDMGLSTFTLKENVCNIIFLQVMGHPLRGHGAWAYHEFTLLCISLWLFMSLVVEGLSGRSQSISPWLSAVSWDWSLVWGELSLGTFYSIILASLLPLAYLLLYMIPTLNTPLKTLPRKFLFISYHIIFEGFLFQK